MVLSPLQAGGTRFNKCGCKGFFHKRAPSINVRRPPQPSAAKPLSNLRTLGATAPSNFRTLKPHRAPGRLYGFRRQRQHKKWRPKGRRASPAQQYYITPEGESPQPVREASAGPGQNPGSPGPSGPAAASTLARRASTFGNTGKHRPGPGPGPDRAERRLNPQAP